jgi:hypothetical protein
MAHSDSGGDPNSVEAGRELADVAIPSLFHQAFYLVIVCVAVWLAMAGLFKFAIGRMEAGDAPVSPLARPAGQLPPGPRLLTDEPGNLRDFRAGETRQLDEYGWTDKAAGAVHIPIDRAKDLLLERGLPVREGQAADETPVRPPVVDRDDRPIYARPAGGEGGH